MSKQLFVKENGSEFIDVTVDGTHETRALIGDKSFKMQDGYFYVQFFDGSFNEVTPTGGTVDPEMSPIGDQFLKGSPSTSISAAECGPVATYTPPRFLGAASKGRVTFTGITGATYARCKFWRV